MIGAEPEHVAQFFDDEPAFSTRIAEFLAEGLRQDDAILVLATPAHVGAIERSLDQLGFDSARLRRNPRFIVLDAEQALSQICANGAPNSILFGAVIGAALQRAQDAGRRVRAFGELVSLLWRQGRRDDAVVVEQLWNELIGFHPIALLCGYQFDGVIDASGFERISATHDRVEPPPRREAARQIGGSQL